MSKHHPVDLRHLVRDPGRDRRQDPLGKPGPVRGHGVLAGHRPQYDRVAVTAAVALDADRADIRQQDNRALPDAAVQPGGRQLGPDDRVRRRDDAQPLAGDLADDPDRQSGAGERLPPDDLSGSPSSSPTCLTSSLNKSRSGSTSSNFRSSGSPPDVVVRLDIGRAGAAARLHHVRVRVPCTRNVARLCHRRYPARPARTPG